MAWDLSRFAEVLCLYMAFLLPATTISILQSISYITANTQILSAIPLKSNGAINKVEYLVIFSYLFTV